MLSDKIAEGEMLPGKIVGQIYGSVCGYPLSNQGISTP